MSILDSVVQVGIETGAYGTAVAPTRAFEAKSDPWQRDVEYIESVGFRKDQQTIRSDRHDTISVGATVSIEIDVLNKGLGLLLQHALGGSSGPTQQGGTAAYKSTFETNDVGPATSYTVQVGKADSNGSVQAFTYEGSMVTGWSISADVGSAVSMTFDFDSEAEQNTTALATPSYPSGSDVFTYVDCTVEIDDSAQSTFTSFSLSGDLGMKTDRRFLKGSAVKGQPKRSSLPSYTGSISGEFATMGNYEKFVAGTTFKLEFIAAMSTAIAGSYYPTFAVTMPSCVFTGSTPTASLDDLSTIELPFTVLDNGSDAAVKIEYTSTDTAF